ncbi:hypothetical protein PVAP13_6NG038832 [Panicum virgatum]|uniref:Uncharacterized protein n=1 Tax=Panicum virgatum TaxID=38727 RepID=A0A8T0QT95_PANVG|nr:hypothetical protein PVAP13_6NG038832 [Panicum virgatum]
MLLTSTPALIGRLLLNRPTLLLQNRVLIFQVCFPLTLHQWA